MDIISSFFTPTWKKYDIYYRSIDFSYMNNNKF